MLMNYYRHIDRTKVQFDFLCNKSKPGAYDKEILSMGGRIFRTPGLNPAKYPKYLKYMKKLFEEHPEYRILEAHNDALGVYALHAAKVNDIPVRIFHAHGTQIASDWKFLIKYVCKSFLPSNMNMHFTCGIEAAKFYFGKEIVKNGDYELITNAIDVEKFQFNKITRDIFRAKYKLDGKYVIGHIGRFMKQKNHTFLLDVFYELQKNNPYAMLVLLGDGELMDKMKLKAAKMKMEDKVLFVGNVSNANEWYQAFDCFVLPSVWEGLPVVGVEAQDADLPCVFSDSITKEIAFSDKAFFVPLSASIETWVKKINDMRQYSERTECMELIRKNGYDIVTEAVKLQNRYIQLSEENI